MSLLITDAGIAASIQASNLGVSYNITHIAMGASGYTPTHNQTTLRNEIVRRPITQGSIPALGQLHFEVLFDGKIEYEAREIGYFLEDGTLFAVDSREGDIISIKRADTIITEVFDLTLSGSEIDTITVELIGAINATEHVPGIAKIATDAQVAEGQDNSAFLTIKKLLLRTANTISAGVVQLSNSYKGSRETVAVTEKALNDGLATTYGPKRKPPKQRLTLVRHPGTIGTLTKEEKEFWYDIPVDNMQFLQLTVSLGATGLSQYNPENTFSATPYDEYGNDFIPFIGCKWPFSFGSILIFIPEGAKRIQFRLSEGASSDISARLFTDYYLV